MTCTEIKQLAADALAFLDSNNDGVVTYGDNLT